MRICKRNLTYLWQASKFKLTSWKCFSLFSDEQGLKVKSFQPKFHVGSIKILFFWPSFSNPNLCFGYFSYQSSLWSHQKLSSACDPLGKQNPVLPHSYHHGEENHLFYHLPSRSVMIDELLILLKFSALVSRVFFIYYFNFVSPFATSSEFCQSSILCANLHERIAIIFHISFFHIGPAMRERRIIFKQRHEIRPKCWNGKVVIWLQTLCIDERKEKNILFHRSLVGKLANIFNEAFLQTFFITETRIETPSKLKVKLPLLLNAF